MYLHLGGDTVIRQEDIVGIFDLETSTISQTTRGFLAHVQKTGSVVNVSVDMPSSIDVTTSKEEIASIGIPKTFVLCRNKNKRETLYITQISSATLLKRINFPDNSANLLQNV